MMTFAVLPIPPYRLFVSPSQWNPKADRRAKEARDDGLTADRNAWEVTVSHGAGFRSGTRPTKERIPVGRNETALHPYSHSQPLRAHSGIVLKINIFHVEKGRSPRKRARIDRFKADRRAKELAMTDSKQIAAQKRLAMTESRQIAAQKRLAMTDSKQIAIPCFTGTGATLVKRHKGWRGPR